MRVLLAILVGVVQVAGPLLCCCLPARLAAAPVERSAPAEPVCPHYRPVKSAEPNAPAERDRSPLPHHCPCGGKSLQAVTPKLIEPSSDLELTGLVLPSLVLFPVVQPSPRPVAVAGVSDLPFLSTQTRLFTHHALRC